MAVGVSWGPRLCNHLPRSPAGSSFEPLKGERVTLRAMSRFRVAFSWQAPVVLPQGTRDKQIATGRGWLSVLWAGSQTDSMLLNIGG
jgi:hypothetical protein